MTSTLQKLCATSLLLLCVLGSTGCVTRTFVIDSQADVVRLGDNVKGDVYVYQNSQWVKVKNVHLPAGWTAGAVPE